MKIKTDHVTNSSSVSFCGYGCSFETSELREMLKDWVTEIVPDDEDDYAFFDSIDELLGKNGLTRLSSDYNNYIGAIFADAGMDESQNDIKKRVEESFKKLGLKGNVNFIEESWRDG